MHYLTVMALACLITVSTFSQADENDAMANRVVESALQECDGDEECLAEYSKRLEETQARLRRQIEYTDRVLEEAREAAPKPATRQRREWPELQSGSEIYRELIGTDPY